MTRSIIHLGVGQCGCQVGFEFWKQVSQSHGIDNQGLLYDTYMNLNDRKDVFFYQADDSHYVPRSVFIDLEPRVINSMKDSSYKSLFNAESFFIGGNGGGAGNLWPAGFSAGAAYYEDLMEIINREAEAADSLQGFMMTHSVAGGTGSGLGSFLLENISDLFSKKLLTNFAILPNTNQSSDTVVQHYNTILALKRLALYSDAVFTLDNTALDRVAMNTIDLTQASFTEVNQLVASMMCSTTSTMRFPDYMNTDLISLLASLIPTPRCHFISSAYTPFAPPSSIVTSRPIKTSVQDIITRLMNPKNSLLSIPQRGYKSTECYISMLNIIDGDVDAVELNRDLQRVRASSNTSFISWAPSNIQVALSRRSPYSPSKNRVTGCMLANYTGIRHVFKKHLDGVSKMYANKAFMTNYENACKDFDINQDIQDSINVVSSLVDEYTAVENPNYASEYLH